MGFLGFYKGGYCVWSKVLFKPMWTPFKITFDIIKFPLSFLFTSAMRWLLRFHKLMLAQLLLVLSSTKRTLTMWPAPSDTIYLYWLCELNLLNGWAVVSAESVNRNPDYIACIENSKSFIKLIRICCILLVNVQYALDTANVTKWLYLKHFDLGKL